MAIMKKKFKNGDYFKWDDEIKKHPLEIVDCGQTYVPSKRRAEALYHFLDQIFGDDNKSRR